MQFEELHRWLGLANIWPISSYVMIPGCVEVWNWFWKIIWHKICVKPKYDFYNYKNYNPECRNYVSKLICWIYFHGRQRNKSWGAVDEMKATLKDITRLAVEWYRNWARHSAQRICSNKPITTVERWENKSDNSDVSQNCGWCRSVWPLYCTVFSQNNIQEKTRFMVI